MYPDRTRSGYITARDQSMVESGVTEGGEKNCQFSFSWMNNNTNMKPQAIKKASIFKVIAEEKQQLVEKKDADNIRKVLCRSFI